MERIGPFAMPFLESNSGVVFARLVLANLERC